MVVFHHFPFAFNGYGSSFFRSGFAGVTVFFVLSGFVISWNYLDQARSPTLATTWNYFIARIARVYPLYVGFLLFVYFAFYGGLVDQRLFIAHLLMVQAWLPHLEDAYAFNSQAWSVSVEIFFYALFPVLALILDRLGVFGSSRRMVLLGSLILMIMLAAAIWLSDPARPYSPEKPDHFWLYRHPLPRLGDFTLGLLAAQWCRLKLANSGQTSVRLWAGVSFVSMFCILLMLREPYLYSSSYSWDVEYAVPALMLIVGLTLAEKSLLNRFLSHRFMLLLGEASYALYLCQLLAGNALLELRSFQSKTVLTGFIWVSAMVLLSVILHVVVEKPCRRGLIALLRVRSAAPGRASPAVHRNAF